MEPIALNGLWNYTDVDRAFWSEHLAEWLPARIIDAHVHVANRTRGASAEEKPEQKERMEPPYWPEQVSRPQNMEQCESCIRTILPGKQVQCIVLDTTKVDWDRYQLSDYLRTECLKRDWFGTIPLDPEMSEERLASWLDKPGIIGVKPYYSMLRRRPGSRVDEMTVSIFDYCPHHLLTVLNAYGAWMTLHIPRAERMADPDNIREIKELRERYPNIVLVIAHIGRCYSTPHAQEAIPQLADDPGLYFDISAVYNPVTLRMALEYYGPDRLCWGTDNPVFYMRGRRVHEGREYFDYTSGDFQFNKGRHEPPAVEAQYTLYTYEALKMAKDVCEELRVDRRGVEALLFGTADRLIQRVLAAKPSQQ